MVADPSTICWSTFCSVTQNIVSGWRPPCRSLFRVLGFFLSILFLLSLPLHSFCVRFQSLIAIRLSFSLYWAKSIFPFISVLARSCCSILKLLFRLVMDGFQVSWVIRFLLKSAKRISCVLSFSLLSLSLNVERSFPCFSIRTQFFFNEWNVPSCWLVFTLLFCFTTRFPVNFFSSQRVFVGCASSPTVYCFDGGSLLRYLHIAWQ